MARRVGLLAQSFARALSTEATVTSCRHVLTLEVAAATAAVTGAATIWYKNDLTPWWRSFAAAAETRAKEQWGLPSVVLYQYQVCPFCCKVRAFLDYHRIPYEVVEVNPVSKGELKWSSYKKVPVVKLGDRQLTDSDRIISIIADELGQSTKERNPRIASDGTAEEDKWRTWVNQRFVRIITANIYRSLGESWQTFDYIVEHGNFGGMSRMMTRMAGTATMYVIGRRMPQKYHIEGDLRQALYTAAQEWTTAVGKSDYLGGRQPNLADLAVFGVVRAIEGTSTYKDLMEKTDIREWYARMTNEVGTSCRTNSIEQNSDQAEYVS